LIVPIMQTPRVKCNISGDTKQIYHTPGTQFYDSVTIDFFAGERYALTETQAMEWGFRRPLNQK
jgi:hypothetical protein